MTIMILWMMILGGIATELALAAAVPTYRHRAQESLRFNLMGSLGIAVFWAVFMGLIGGGGAITAGLLPVTVPIQTVACIPFYKLSYLWDTNQTKIAETRIKLRQTYEGIWFLLRIVFFPVRMLGKMLIWASAKTA